MADGYFEQALDGLRNAASADYLWARELPPWYSDDDSFFGPIQRRMTAVDQRYNALRSSVLFSALAAEATANEFLAIVLPPSEVQAIDRLPTVDKLLIGTKLAGATSPFARGREPLQTLKGLAAARNTLVHPRPGQAATHSYVVVLDRDVEVYGPRAAASYLIAAAHSGVLLRGLLTYPHTFASLAQRILEQRTVIDDHLVRFDEGDLRRLPDRTAEPIRDLHAQMDARAAAQGQRDKRTPEERRQAMRDEPRGPLRRWRPPLADNGPPR